MKILSLRLATLSVATLICLSVGRAEDAIPPTPPGGSSAPASSTNTTTSGTSIQQKALSSNPNKQGEHAKHLEMLKQELGLTPEQVQKMRPILKTAHEQAKAVRANASLDEQQKRQQMRQIFAAAFQQFKPILTKTQLAKLKELRAQRRGASSAT